MADELHKQILAILGYVCDLHNGELRFCGEEAPQVICDAICLISHDIREFLQADLDVLLASLTDIQKDRVKDYQASEIKKLEKAAILDALTEHLYNDGEVDLQSETWATAKADAIASVQTSLSAGLIAEVLVDPKVIVK